MTAVGLDTFVTFMPEEYLRRAVDWASDLARLNALRQYLPPRVAPNPVGDERNMTVEFEAVMRDAWGA